MEQRIEIVIKENGALNIKADGFVGEKCLEDVKKIIDEPFAEIVKTDEFYQKRQSVNQQTVMAGA